MDVEGRLLLAGDAPRMSPFQMVGSAGTLAIRMLTIFARKLVSVLEGETGQALYVTRMSRNDCLLQKTLGRKTTHKPWT